MILVDLVIDRTTLFKYSAMEQNAADYTSGFVRYA
jgi:hypothetical protein